MKAAIIVLSDPNANSEEALGRVFNGLAAAYELKQNGDEVTVVFQGAGTRWLKLLSAPEHPVHGLFELVIALLARRPPAQPFSVLQRMWQSPVYLSFQRIRYPVRLVLRAFGSGLSTEARS
jgi:hypothetical protein